MSILCRLSTYLYVFSMMVASLTGIAGVEAQPRSEVQDVKYSPVIDTLEEVIADELQRGHVNGVSIALVDDQQVMLSEGYG